MPAEVEIVRELDGWKGQVCLVRYAGGNEVRHFIVSSVVAPYSGFETLVFPADAQGEPVGLLFEVAGGKGMSREEAIADLASQTPEELDSHWDQDEGKED